MPAKFLISIIGLNRLEATKRCLASVFANSSDFELLLTNNGSSDDTGAYFDEVARNNPNVRVIHEVENTGFIPPNNRAFEFAVKQGNRYFIALNNDTEVPPKWLEKLEAPLLLNPKIALSGPMGTCNMLLPNMHGVDGHETEYIEGSCLCVRVEIVKQFIPLFSHYLKMMYAEDSDLSLRMREKGFGIAKANFSIKHARGETSKGDPELKRKCEETQEANHVVMQRRWSHYIRHRTFSHPIIIRRRGAIGDVLLASPVIKAIREMKPLAKIQFETGVPEVLQYNLNVNRAAKLIAKTPNSLFVDLEMAYENRPGMHIIEAYEQAAREVIFDLPKVELRPEMHLDNAHEQYGAKMRASICGKNDKLCLLHSDAGDWPGKNWPPEYFARLATALVMSGWHVAVIGRNPRHPLIKNSLDLTRKTTIHQLAALLKHSQLFIGVDSAPMHFAMAAGCPTIGLFGVTSARYIMTNGAPHIGVEADKAIPCSGRRHRESGKTFIDCSTDCINSVSVERVLQAVENIFK